MNYSIGIDLGATKILSGIVDENGNIIFSIKNDTDKKGGLFLINQIKDIINFLLNKSVELKLKISSIGIGSPGRVDTKSGIIKDCTPNIKNWKGVNLKEELFNFTKVPIFVDNDANVSAFGEYIYSCGNNQEIVVVLTLGTGLGSGIIYKGKIFRGKGLASEIGHSIIEKNGRICNCGQRGCLEAYVSGTAIENRVKELLIKYPESNLNKLKKITSHDIFNFANKNDFLSVIVIDEFIDYLSSGIISLVNILDPSKIILAGGISDNIVNYLDIIKGRVSSQINISNFDTEIIKISKLTSNLGLIGAALISLFGIKTGEI
jgi:glucokinase